MDMNLSILKAACEKEITTLFPFASPFVGSQFWEFNYDSYINIPSNKSFERNLFFALLILEEIDYIEMGE